MRNDRKSILALLAVAVTVVVLGITNGTISPKEATWSDVVSEAENGEYQLITTDDLWKRYSQKPGSLLLVDTRQEWEYRAGHIAGAVNFPFEPTWFARWRAKGDLDRFLGEDKDHPVVFY